MNISTHSVISCHSTGFKPPAETADEDTTSWWVEIVRFQRITSTRSQRLRFGARILLKALALNFSCLVFLFASFASAQATVAATPTFSPAAGTYSSAQTVTISTATPSATIYYTTNGTTPTTNSTIYSGAIIVSASARVEAIATTNSLSTSAVGSAAYKIGTAIALSCFGMSLGNAASLNGFVPFPSTNAWNTNIVSAPVDPNSATRQGLPGGTYIPILEPKANLEFPTLS